MDSAENTKAKSLVRPWFVALGASIASGIYAILFWIAGIVPIALVFGIVSILGFIGCLLTLFVTGGS